MREILGVGTDLCQISKLSQQADNPRFLQKYFTPEEQAYILSKHNAAPETLAGIFAAKEAALKAMGTGIAFPLRDISVSHSPSGQPSLILTGSAASAFPSVSFLLSISHEADFAQAYVIMGI